MPDLLPPNANNQERALSLTVDRLPDVPIRTLWSPATCPAAQLPWLAWALSVDEWDSTWPEATKRQAIADSIEGHRKKGTVGALRRALQRLGYEVEIDENTGASYTFKLRFRVREGDATGGAVLDSAITQATALALKQKNVRSYLADTDLLAETSPAALWIGGVTISGAECDIVSAPTVMPLDGFTSRVLGSFWTVRVNSFYTGPIATVQRESDGATLDYYSVPELREFVGAGDFNYTAFYNQVAGYYIRLPFAVPATFWFGGFDSNGVPFAGGEGQVSITSLAASAGTIVVVADLLTDLATNTSISVGGNGSFGLSPSTSPMEAVLYRSSGATPVAATISEPSPLKKIAAARFNSSTVKLISETSDSEANVAGSPVLSTFSIDAKPDDIGDDEPPRFYGAAAWWKDLGDSNISTLRASLSSLFNF